MTPVDPANPVDPVLAADTVDSRGPADRPTGSGFSRRRLLGFAGAGAAVVGAGVAGVAIGRSEESASESAAAASASLHDVVAFNGPHQAGIVTPAQDRLHFVALDLTTDRREDLIDLLTTWTAAAARMTQGQGAGPLGPVSGAYEAPPDDTGEAMGLPASQLTITFGFGPSLFTDGSGRDRFGLADRRPAGLVELPHFPGDTLDPARSGGDLCIQACANDPQVAVHAIRNLVRLAFGSAVVRWSQLGFGRTSSTSTTQTTARNLMGFKDGTANIKAEDPATVNAQVWVQDGDDVDWMTGGSYLVARRIRMTIETWDRAPLGEQELIIGRTKGEGAPLSGGNEFTEPDFTMLGAENEPLIPVDAHVRLAHPSSNGGAQLLRRGYNFVDGSDALGRLDAGLFFISYQRSITDQFVRVQKSLAGDPLNEYIRHVGSAVFAVPPGVATSGDYVGSALFN